MSVDSHACAIWCDSSVPLQVFVVIVEGDPREAIHKSALGLSIACVDG